MSSEVGFWSSCSPRRRRSSGESRSDSPSRHAAPWRHPERVEGSWGIEPVPDAAARARRARHRPAVGEPRRLAARRRRRRGARPRALAARRAASRSSSAASSATSCSASPALIGADARVPGHGAHARAARPARLAISRPAINVLQGIGWSIFELLDHRDGRGRALGRALRLPRAVAVDDRLRRVSRSCSRCSGRSGSCAASSGRFAIWAVPLALVYLTWWALDGADLGALWDAPGEGGLSVWQGADVVVAITVSWIPYAADYTRFSTTRRGAFAGTGDRVLRPGRVAARARRRARPLARPRRSRRASGRGRRGRVRRDRSRSSRCS